MIETLTCLIWFAAGFMSCLFLWLAWQSLSEPYMIEGPAPWEESPLPEWVARCDSDYPPARTDAEGKLM